MDELSAKHVAMLEARGIDAERAAALGVVSSPRLGGDAIAIPYLVNGQTVNHKYRTIAGPKRFEQDRDARKVFWNVDALTDATLADLPLIVTEGELDAMVAMQCGFVRVVSVPDGAPAKTIGDQESTKYEFLTESESALRSVREIILAVDNDGPGVNLMHDLGIRLGKGRCRYVSYPPGCKDLNDTLLRHGPAAVTRAINEARWLKVTGLFRMSELPAINEAVPHDPCIGDLKRHYRLRLGDFCVVTGIPSMGKSTFVNDLACRMSTHWNWSTAFASFEQHPQIDHRRALRAWKIQKPENEFTADDYARADAWIDRRFSFIIPDEDEECTLAWLLERMAASVIRHNVQMIVVDPWNELDHDRPGDMSLTEYVGFAIRQFKKFARKYNVHLIVVAHPAKLQTKPDGSLPVPSLYSISDSAHWANKPDVGLVIHREKEGDTLIKVAKSRYHEAIGKPGTIKADFSEITRRYVQVEDRYRAGDYA